MSDGPRLAARAWLPEDADQNPVPALFELTPYRKREIGRAGDFTYYASHGYATLLVEIRGTGDSGGLPQDEYVRQEQERRRRNRRMARAATVVHGEGGYVRRLLDWIQCPADRGSPPTGSEGDHHSRLDGRSLYGRCTLYGGHDQ